MIYFRILKNYKDKLFLVVLLIILCISSAGYSQTEISERDKEVMQEFVSLLNDYMEAWQLNYENMSKFQEPYYTYNDSILKGVAYNAGVEKSICDNVAIIIYFKNQTKRPINISKCNFGGVDNKRNTYKFELEAIYYNSGITGSSVVNPDQEIAFSCLTPFIDTSQLRDIDEIFINRGDKWIFFVPESKIEIYKKTKNIIMRHLRNLWWNVRL